MTASTAPRRIALAVVNPEALQRGCAPSHTFDRAGGTIGCRGANWILTDHRDRIQPIHCEIVLDEGLFCIVDRSGQTRINSQDSPMGLHVSARLNDGDTLHIGPYRIAIHLHDQDHPLPDPSRHLSQYGIGELLNVQDEHLRELMTAPPVQDDEPFLRRKDADFQALSSAGNRRDDLDPLMALDMAERRAAEEEAARSPLDPTHYGLAPASPQADLAATRFEAVSGSPNPLTGESTMSHQHAPTPAQDWHAAQQHHGADPHQLAAPLLQGLGAPLGPLDEQAAYNLLLEAGQALNATIRGIAALYGSQAGNQRRLTLLGRTLQPIEDNPLRLGQDHADTVRALFSSERSVVHLSPRAAIEESLTQARQHNAAIIQAIGASLDALLHAFSPDVLLQRFQRYRPEQAQQPADGDWAWQMYTHYYNELASSRQQGFEKLFWEVFEQAYDRALRAEA